MSLHSLRLENFRGFTDATIKTKPLTVLVGANSSGKSSFSQALAVMAHANRLYANSPGLTLTPIDTPEAWPADLGYLEDVRKTGAKGPVYVSIETDEGVVRWGFGLDLETERNRPLDVTYVSQPAALNLLPESISEATVTAHVPVAVSGNFVATSESTPFTANVHSFRKINEQQWKELPGGIDSFVDLRGLTLNTVSHSIGTPVLLNHPVREEIQEILGNITYLRAVRGRPSRSYPTRNRSPQASVGYGGEGCRNFA